MTEKNLPTSPSQDLVAYWSVPLVDGVHTVEFEHGTTTGKRVLRLDGKEILRKEWMFKLVGDLKFPLGKQKAQCELRVDPIPAFSFTYSLLVDGKPVEKFTEKQLKTIKSWSVVENGKRYGIVFSKQTLELWINGQNVEPEMDFVEGGTEIRFVLGYSEAVIRSTSTNESKEIVYTLYVGNKLIFDDNNNK